MERLFDTYCIECDDEVAAVLEDRDERLAIRGESVPYSATVAVCPRCGCIIADSRIESANLDRAYSAYRMAHGLVSPEEISRIRNEIGLSLREYARFLGFGEQTVAKYENGSIPDELHSNLIRFSADANGAAALFRMNGASISEASSRKVKAYIAGKSQQPGEDPLWSCAGQFIDAAVMEPCAANGYRTLDFGRLAAVAAYFAERCCDLFKTKFQKAMFFSDSLIFERTGRSATGICYAHADFGPVMNDYDEILCRLELEGYVKRCSKDWGTIVAPGLRHPEPILSEDEMEILEEVALFVDSFRSAKEISEYSHTLRAWSDTKSGAIIEYGASFGEVSEAVAKRIGA